MATITTDQIRYLQTARKSLGLDDDLYHEIIRQEAGVSSTKDLDYRGFEKIKQRFVKMGWADKTPKRKPKRVKQPYGTELRKGQGDPDSLPTPAQLAFMNHLYLELGCDTLERQNGFNRRQTKSTTHPDGVPWPQTRDQASRIIEALKRMKERGYKAGDRYEAR